MVNKVLLIGVQGTGKTWVMKSIIEQFKCERRQKIRSLYFHKSDNADDKKQIIVAGMYDGTTFEGTDRLSLGVMQDYPAFLSHTQPYFVLLEGDRFTNFTVLDKHQRPFVIKIDNDGKEGRAKRGVKQSETALKRIKTRIDNITPDVSVKDSNEALELITTLINDYLGNYDKN
jgi:hypothetical protein